jgi:hypothetical protein
MRTSDILKACAFAAAALLAACSGGQQSGGPSASPSAPLRNPLDFPLYPESSVLTARQFTQDIHAQTSSTDSVFAAGNGTYTGHEVVASSQASFSELSAWVEKVASTPPAGYSSVETGSNPQEHTQAERYGIDYALFQKKGGNHTRGVLLIVMDPQRVNQRFGTLLGMISRYRSLPAVMRTPIDNEAKARIGMTLSDATAPESPIGAALAALNQLQNKDARGIVIVDAAKR